MPDPKTSNEEFFDALVRHAILLQLLGRGINKQLIDLLNKTEKDIARTIRESLRSSRGLTPRNVARMNKLIREIRDIRFAAWKDTELLWVDAFRELVKSEVLFTAGTVQLVLPIVIETVLPSAAQLNALVRTHPFEGRVLKEWAQDIRRADLQRMTDQIRIGMARGETSDEISRRIVGSARLRGSNGVTQISRNAALSITMTAINSFSNAAREAFFDENADLIDEERYVATLDGRTTAVCRGLDGKVYKHGEGPKPPMHFRCRSLRVAIFDGQVIGERPAKAVVETQLLDEFTRRNGLGRVKTRDGLPFGKKGAFDAYRRQRVRELTGRVPAKVTYNDWLRTQSSMFQDTVLGKTKGKLFRQGGLPLDRFTDPAGREYSLGQLARIESDAFRAAGLDPSNFLR